MFCIIYKKSISFLNSPPCPSGTHSNYFTDGGICSNPIDHAMSAKRMLCLLVHHLLRQLPYPVRWSGQEFLNSIDVCIDGEWVSGDIWEHCPSTLINDPDNTPRLQPAQPILVNDEVHYPPSSHFPSRQRVFNAFSAAFVKYGKAIPEIASHGVLNDMPSGLKPPSMDARMMRSQDKCVHSFHKPFRLVLH